MKKMLVLAMFVLLFALPVCNTAVAQIAKETALMSKALPDVTGKEGVVETVVLTPREVVPAHCHNADVFAYVLEGSVMTQLKDGKPQTVRAGEVFYESPADIHIASRNTNTTQPATLLVFYVKKIGAPTTVTLGSAIAAHEDLK